MKLIVRRVKIIIINKKKKKLFFFYNLQNKVTNNLKHGAELKKLPKKETPTLEPAQSTVSQGGLY
jgi:hypothetical protein